MGSGSSAAKYRSNDDQPIIIGSDPSKLGQAFKGKEDALKSELASLRGGCRGSYRSDGVRKAAARSTSATAQPSSNISNLAYAPDPRTIAISNQTRPVEPVSAGGSSSPAAANSARARAGPNAHGHTHSNTTNSHDHSHHCNHRNCKHNKSNASNHELSGSGDKAVIESATSQSMSASSGSSLSRAAPSTTSATATIEEARRIDDELIDVAPAAQPRVQPTGLPARKPWQMPANGMPAFLPPLRAPSPPRRSKLRPEDAASSSAVARMAAEYWQFENRGRPNGQAGNHSGQLAGTGNNQNGSRPTTGTTGSGPFDAGGSNAAATSTTQSWTSKASGAPSVASAAAVVW
eukprot:TRINITY_DN9072_c1_g1_i1.p1 TRINITY_DN9072_c1_g1~~TRINITY_DN9072_c1_g1_i1.p1  ORF type:complete len:348 (+),score=68.45 TRINITY_DN9072_c1_g1_i1:74-1117(+)